MFNVKKAMEIFKNENMEDSIYIPINSLLKNLESYEVESYKINYKGIKVSLNDFVDENFNEDIEPVTCDNTYNWYSPISKDIDYQIYKDYLYDRYLMEVKIHLGGDIRGNYSDSLWFESYYSMEDLLEPLLETIKGFDFEYKGYDIYVSYGIMNEAGACEVAIYKEYDEVEIFDTYCDTNTIEGMKNIIIEKLKSDYGWE